MSENFTDWQERHQREVELQDKETQERIARNNTRIDIELEMIRASEQLRLDEMLDGKSEEYKRGFQDGRMFESTVTYAILNAATKA
ncbi:MAG: hypothetical protein ABID71_02070 [Chloroflexota bacterium]